MLMLFAGIGVSAKELTFVTHASTSVEQLKIQALAEEWGQVMICNLRVSHLGTML
jgi:hypothetical protein